ncbi:hypothetical protein FIBSPDRAFT_856513 [Athelia psychrophila]|uniref:Uncharacterized protein n=1 Tax=Athelia psychrophila TaxID=1759441 RepID=A0A166N884_9AGAM|nr:hypothetical protein FIBSPDRAFT_856513 [Fibularhizoctonia sp. CBS 109695]
MLLGASALQEVLIAVSCLLLVHRTSFEESRRVFLHFFLFISAGCLVGIALSLAMVVCRLKSANHAWDVLSMIAPLYRVTFLLAHLTYQRSVLDKQIGRNNADIMTLVDMQPDTPGSASGALSSSSQSSSTWLSPGTLPATEDVDSEAGSRMCRRREDEDARTAAPAACRSQDQVILDTNSI